MSACVREREKVRGAHENIILWQKLIYIYVVSTFFRHRLRFKLKAWLRLKPRLWLRLKQWTLLRLIGK